MPEEKTESKETLSDKEDHNSCEESETGRRQQQWKIADMTPFLKKSGKNGKVI